MDMVMDMVMDPHTAPTESEVKEHCENLLVLLLALPIGLSDFF